MFTALQLHCLPLQHKWTARRWHRNNSSMNGSMMMDNLDNKMKARVQPGALGLQELRTAAWDTQQNQ